MYKDYLICRHGCETDQKCHFCLGYRERFCAPIYQIDIYIHTNHIRCVIYALCLEIIEKTKCKDQQGLFYVA